MAKQIIDQAVNFQVDELFFSRTDYRGVILDGNDVFVRVSGFSRDELLGKPHSIIRHPDMPRIVFKLLWDTIGAGKPIGAYVKNCAKDGRYYWVFACVFPIGNDYLSLRLKPTSPLLEVVKGLYAALLEHEKANGMEACVEPLMAALKQHGFPDYESFMAHALVTELQARADAMASQAATSKTTDHATVVCSGIAEQFGRVFSDITAIRTTITALQESSAALADNCGSLDTVGLNLMISASQLGNVGRPLMVIASSFQDVSSEIRARADHLSEAAEKLVSTIDGSRFSLGSARIQLDMLAFVLRERAMRTEDTGVEVDCVALLKLGQEMLGKAMERLEEVSGAIAAYSLARLALEQSCRHVVIAERFGRIEAAQTVETAASCRHHIDILRDFGSQLNNSMAKIEHSFTEAQTAVSIGVSAVRSINRAVENLDRETLDSIGVVAAA